MPSPEDRMRIDHDLYGIFSPYADTCSVAQWMEYANKSIAVSHENGQRAWVVGGTGFYLKALTQGLSPIPILDAAQKAILRNQHADTTIDQIKTMLQPIDAISAEKFVDKQRLLHAWIVHTLTGKPLSWWHLQKPIAPALHFVHVLIWPSRNLILHRAEQRWEKMIHHGVYQEVQAFCSNPLWQTSPLRKAIGVQPIHAMLQGQMSEKECRQQYLIDIAQYVKRQRTWFRGQFKPDYVYTPE